MRIVRFDQHTNGFTRPTFGVVVLSARRLSVCVRVCAVRQPCACVCVRVWSVCRAFKWPAKQNIIRSDYLKCHILMWISILTAYKHTHTTARHAIAYTSPFNVYNVVHANWILMGDNKNKRPLNISVFFFLHGNVHFNKWFTYLNKKTLSDTFSVSVALKLMIITICFSSSFSSLRCEVWTKWFHFFSFIHYYYYYYSY